MTVFSEKQVSTCVNISTTQSLAGGVLENQDTRGYSVANGSRCLILAFYCGWLQHVTESSVFIMGSFFSKLYEPNSDNDTSSRI